MAFEVVLFDFGGTLDGPADPWLQRFARAYAQAGVDLPFDRLRSAFGTSTRSAYACSEVRDYDLAQTVRHHTTVQREILGLPEETAERATGAFLDRTRDALERSRQLLAQWQGRARFGVISNFYGNVARILADFGFTSSHVGRAVPATFRERGGHSPPYPAQSNSPVPLLETILDSTVVGFGKPDPRIFHAALDALGARADCTLYIGDSYEKDVLGARNAGLHAAWLATPDQRAAHREYEGIRLERLENLEALLT